MAGASDLDTMGRSRINAPGPTVQPDDSLSCSPCLVLLLLTTKMVGLGLFSNQAR